MRCVLSLFLILSAVVVTLVHADDGITSDFLNAFNAALRDAVADSSWNTDYNTHLDKVILSFADLNPYISQSLASLRYPPAPLGSTMLGQLIDADEGTIIAGYSGTVPAFCDMPLVDGDSPTGFDIDLVENLVTKIATFYENKQGLTVQWVHYDTVEAAFASNAHIFVGAIPIEPMVPIPGANYGYPYLTTNSTIMHSGEAWESGHDLCYFMTEAQLQSEVHCWCNMTAENAVAAITACNPNAATHFQTYASYGALLDAFAAGQCDVLVGDRAVMEFGVKSAYSQMDTCIEEDLELELTPQTVSYSIAIRPNNFDATSGNSELAEAWSTAYWSISQDLRALYHSTFGHTADEGLWTAEIMDGSYPDYNDLDPSGTLLNVLGRRTLTVSLREDFTDLLGGYEQRLVELVVQELEQYYHRAISIKWERSSNTSDPLTALRYLDICGTSPLPEDLDCDRSVDMAIGLIEMTSQVTDSHQLGARYLDVNMRLFSRPGSPPSGYAASDLMGMAVLPASPVFCVSDTAGTYTNASSVILDEMDTLRAQTLPGSPLTRVSFPSQAALRDAMLADGSSCDIGLMLNEVGWVTEACEAGVTTSDCLWQWGDDFQVMTQFKIAPAFRLDQTTVVAEEEEGGVEPVVWWEVVCAVLLLVSISVPVIFGIRARRLLN